MKTSYTKTENCSYLKFLFGNSSFTINLYLILTLIIVLVFNMIKPIHDIFYGFTLNSLKEENFSIVKKFVLILILIGILNMCFCIFSGFLCSLHGKLLTKNYKDNYYSLVLDKEYKWFLGKNLNELSESIKTDITKIEAAVILILLIFLDRKKII